MSLPADCPPVSPSPSCVERACVAYWGTTHTICSWADLQSAEQDHIREAMTAALKAAT